MKKSPKNNKRFEDILKMKKNKFIRMLNRGELAYCDSYSFHSILFRKFQLLEELDSLEKELTYISRLEIEQYKHFSDLKNVPPYLQEKALKYIKDYDEYYFGTKE